MADFAVRPARGEEIEAILDLLEDVAEERRWIASEPPIPRERWREGFERRRAEEYSIVLVALDGGERVIGQLDAAARRDRPAEIGMAVAKEWRGQGVGTALMQACVEWARALGIHKLALQVWPHNEPALRLYERFGFEREGVLRGHYRRENGELWDAVVMGVLL